MTWPPRRQILAEVNFERLRQDEKWGEQNHPDGTGPQVRWQGAGQPPAALLRDCMRDACQAAAADGRVMWSHILLEEICEAMAEEDAARLRIELIQTAAVAVAWVEAIDRRLA